jgi:hypothetical protein
LLPWGRWRLTKRLKNSFDDFAHRGATQRQAEVTAVVRPDWGGYDRCGRKTGYDRCGRKQKDGVLCM